MQVEEKRVDSQGRVSLPVDWRKQHLGAEGAVIIIHRGDELIIKARGDRKPSDFFDKLKVEVKSEKFRLRKPLFDNLDDKKFFEEYSKRMGGLKAEYDFRREIWREELPLKVLKKVVIGVLFGLFLLFTVYVVKVLWANMF